jgi:hypothetical protein
MSRPIPSALVESAAAFGLTQADIAEQLGIDEKTLRKHFRIELNGGKFSVLDPRHQASGASTFCTLDTAILISRAPRFLRWLRNISDMDQDAPQRF